jgi:hypothetical protein
MALEHVPRCQHVKVNGVQCGSPALRHGAHCFFHTRVEYERQIAVENHSGKRSFGFPLLEDANSVQVALMKVIQMLGSGVLDHKTAGLMLYALQTASYNLRNARFEPEKLTEVVIDEDTVDLTRVKGPQWSARDFPPAAPAELQGGPQKEAQKEELQEEGGKKAALPQEMSKKEGVQGEAQQGKVNDPVEESAAVSSNVVSVGPGQKCAAPIAAQKSDRRGNEELAELLRRREQKRKLSPDADDGPQSVIGTWLQELGVLSADGVPIKRENQLAATSETGDLAAEGQTVAMGSS